MTFPKLSELVSRKTGLGLALVLLASTVWIIPACSAQSDAAGNDGGGSDVLATIGDQPITRAEVETEAKTQLDQVEMQKLQCESNYKRSKHQVYENVVEQLVQDRLLDKEAEARGITKDDLLKAEVDAKVAEVTDADIDTFYTQNQAQIRQPKEAVTDRIRQYLTQQNQEKAKSDFIASLEAKNKVDYKLGPYRLDIATEGHAAKGPADAPVTIVEFSDFECPYCSRVVPSLDKIKENYGDKVRIVFRNFPLSFHASAQKAAEASLCAGEQGKFWEMHDAMFGDQHALGVDQLKETAAKLGVDADQFNECLDSGKYYDAIQADIRDGVVAGVQGTPAMFINGRFLSGAQPYENIAAIVDEELGANK